MSVTRTTESKEIKDETKPDPIKKLKEAAKYTKPLDPKEVAKMTLEDQIQLCKDTFDSDEHIVTGENYFKEYVKLYGKSEPTFPALSSLFGFKTNQLANHNAILAIGDRSIIRRDLLPKYIFDVLCRLNDIKKSTKSGETVELIKAIISVYRLPLEEDKFDSIREYFSKALDLLAVFNATGGLLPSHLTH